MIEARALTVELRALVRRLEEDIREHAEQGDALEGWLQAEFRRAKEAGRTGQAFKSWRDEQVTLSAVGWVLTCTFVRFCEDNGLIAEARMAGPGERRDAASDTTRYYFQQHPGDSDREYLLWVFDQAGKLPGMKALMEAREGRIHELPLSVDGAAELLEFWRRTDPASGELVFDFTDPDRDTRFLGDLYQDVSEDARKRYALLQTPVFIEEFILDRTLEPAIEDFGLAGVSLIDPACGSGHFLLGAFERLLARWREREPEAYVSVLCQNVFDQVAGVDINPFAVAIAHFRLLVAALNACGIRELHGAPDFKTKLATGDSLLHGHPPGQLPDATGAWARPEHQHFYEVEDRELITKILDHRYAAVVANPPYITPKDPALNGAYRDRYFSCHRAYALSVPFMERLFDLAARPEDGGPAGYVGQITSNSFMKREFGKKLIEDYLASQVDLAYIIDTSGAYVPGHGTPTVVLLGRPRKPVGDTVRGVLGIRGEPSTPADPTKGRVWSEIVALADRPGAEGTYVSVEDIERSRLERHPWSLQGGGAGALQLAVEASCDMTLGDLDSEIGRTTHTGEDDAFYLPPSAARTMGVANDCVPLVEGDQVRDHVASYRTVSIFPYDRLGEPREDVCQATYRHFFTCRTSLKARRDYGRSITERGLRWWDHSMLFPRRYRAPLSITFAFVATHNHFVLDRGGKVFNRSAPVIKLSEGSSKEDYLRILGLLNSSIGCFWMKQVLHCKGSTVDSAGARQTTVPFEDFYEHDSTKLAKFPLPPEAPLGLATALDGSATQLAESTPARLLSDEAPSADLLDSGRTAWLALRQQMFALQEELDWECYRLYGLLDGELTHPPDELPDVELGERAFEIVLARKMAAGELETTWFERHGSTPITEVPSRWPEPYRSLVESRIEAIESVKAIRLIEQPEYKRRWTTLIADRWEEMEAAALRGWVSDRLESEVVWPDTRLQGADQIADRLLRDHDFQVAVDLYAGEEAKPTEVVATLLAEESVPYLAALRYAGQGIEKRAAWERTWELQRAEDRGEPVGSIDPPPKYKKSDFRSQAYWKHRGKLDVPKERFTSYPDAAADGSTLYGWAGWDHARRAQGLSQRIVEAQESEGTARERIQPLLAGLLELLPWLHQWHSEPDPVYGMPLSDFYDSFLEERARAIEATRDDLGAWSPVEARSRRQRKAAA